MNCFISALLLLGFFPLLSHAQYKYGNDFLCTGSGARALARDVTSSFWNVAGLAEVETP
ncbi:MAG TPA: hypothetical protein VFM80_03215 [Gracilimonas sp.]|nr:hypothetical protein [Gracilimonas sp.]